MQKFSGSSDFPVVVTRKFRILCSTTKSDTLLIDNMVSKI